jgi:hypothetical protein
LETSERKWYVKKGPSVQRTKGEKRDHPIEPVLSGLIRRRFLTFLGTGSAALAVGSASALTSCEQGEEQGYQNGKAASTGGKTDGKPTYFQPIKISDTDELILPEGCGYKNIRTSGDPSTANQVYVDRNDYVAYSAIDAREDNEASEDGIHWVNHECVNSMFWSDYTDPESQTKEQVARERAWRLARVKSILAASTRQDWEADGPLLWVCKSDTELRIMDLTDDEGAWNSTKSGPGTQGRARLPSGWSSPSAAAGTRWRRSPRFAWTQAGRSYLGPAKTRTAGWWSLAGSTTFAGSSHRGSIWARTPFAPTCGRRTSL